MPGDLIFECFVAVAIGPITAAIASFVMLPGLKSTGRLVVKSTTVDSSPNAQGPPSRIRVSSGPNSSSTCKAVVGLMRPNLLALGAAIGQSVLDKSFRARLWLGTRIARVSRPALAKKETLHPDRRGKTSVRGPGQNALDNLLAAAFQETSLLASFSFKTWTISGLKRGLPLVSKILATAWLLVASAPKP